MSRVHCIDCGVAVVVDPSGLCPDGHLVGADGARIEAAIGGAVPHPDEPEPWVAKVELDGTSAEPTPEPRTARPPSAPGGQPVEATAPPAAGAAPTPAGPGQPPAPPASGSGRPPADADDLLRELHSLADLGDLGATSPAPARSTAPTDAPVATNGTAPTAPTTPPAPPAPVVSSAEHRDGLAELRALEAAVQALGGSDTHDLATGRVDDTPADDVVTPLPASGDRAPDAAPDREQLADVEELFARRPRPFTEEVPGPGPSQAPPPTEAEAPRPAFQRTPWSSLPVDDPVATPPPTSPPPGASTSVFASGPAPTGPPGRPADGPAAPPSSDEALDIANFTARGRRVGSRSEGRRRRRSR